MKYERPEVFRIGSLEDHTFGGNKETSQDGPDTYSRMHSDPPPTSFRKACETAARSR